MKKYTIYLNSRANIHSTNIITGTTQELFGLTQEEWDSLTENQKDSIAQEKAFDHMLEWGWYEA